MHLTTIILKRGVEVKGVIEKVRVFPVFDNSYIKLFGSNKLFYIKDIESVVTETQRISKDNTVSLDEIKCMETQWERKYNRK